METERIYLRPLELKDYAALSEWNNDESIMKYLGGGYNPISPDLQQKWIENMIDTSAHSVNKRYMIVSKETNESIGVVGLYSIKWIHRTADLGLYIGDKKYHNKGLATEAGTLINIYAKRYLHLRKLNLFVVEENKKAYKFWEKLGFKFAGKLNQERFIDGAYKDVIIMEKFL